MQGDLMAFSYNDQSVRVLMDEAGNPWWVAKDVCDVLGIADSWQACEKLDEDEKLNRKIYGAGQQRDVTTISESGLYTLIMRSNKPEAKPFRRWVTHEVLPSIRKTGGYQAPRPSSPPRPDQVPLTILDRDFGAGIRVCQRAGMTIDECRLKANEMVKELHGVDVLEMVGVKINPPGDAPSPVAKPAQPAKAYSEPRKFTGGGKTPRGYAQTLVQKTGFTQSYISKVLNAKSRASFDRAVILSRVSGISLAIWMSKDEDLIGKAVQDAN
jgi:prophage antirepressor-like protein